MKRTLFVLYFALLAITVNAQSISVASFKMLPNDLTANTNGTEILDQNGDKAALIKVVTTQTGFTFEGGALGICATKQKNGEIWVYVPQKSKKITILHQNLGVLRDYYFPCAIEAARTYEMVLASGSVQTVVTQDVGGNFYALSVTPKSAVVYIDDQLQEVAGDGQYSAMLPYGTHTYRVEANGYIGKSGIFEITNSDLQPINISLVSALSSLNITCATENANILVDNVLVGKGAWDGNIKEGMHLVEVKKTGYRGQKQSVTIAKQEHKELRINALTPIIGRLSVNYKPLGADVFVDGKKLGQSPKVFSNVFAGYHKLQIKKTDYSEYIGIIKVDEGQTTTVAGSLSIFDDSQMSYDSTPTENTYCDTCTVMDHGHFKGEMINGVPNGFGEVAYDNGDYYKGNYVNWYREGKGTYIFADGERYDGEWVHGHQQGMGTFYFANKNKYVGNWFKDYLQGTGIMYYYNGDKYEGNWSQDKRQGSGKYSYNKGAYYDGNWENDMKQGHGVFCWGDGSMYDGQWSANKRCGIGTYTFASGDMYNGQWKDDQPDGRGIYHFQNGDIYEGDYVNGVRTGEGVFMCANGDKYVGHFVNGAKEGQGTYNFSNGDTYVGQWKEGRQSGHGKLTKKSGDIYEGNFNGGHLDGEVIIHYANGNKFRGVFKNGERNGNAIEEDKDGNRFEGSYNGDKRDGDFIEKDSSGRIIAKGTYINGSRKVYK